MAESHNQGHGSETKEKASGCGLFDLLGKKEGKTEDDVVMTDYEEKKEEDKHTLEEVLHRTHSHSSSSSEEEEFEEGGERKTKKKKKVLKETFKEKVSGEKEENGQEPDTVIPADQKCHETGCCEATDGDEKKGFIEKIKEKLPGQHKKTEDGIQTAQPGNAAEGNSPGGETKEKKGILEKIKDKLPGAHKNDDNEVKHKDH